MEEQQKERMKSETREWLNSSFQLAEKSQRFLDKLLDEGIPTSSLFQILSFHQNYQNLLKKLLMRPEKLVDFQVIYWQELFFIWQSLMQQSAQPLGEAFQREAWHEQPLFHCIKDLYLLHLRHVEGLLLFTEALNKKKTKQLQEAVVQFKEILSFKAIVTHNPDIWWSLVDREAEKILGTMEKLINA